MMNPNTYKWALKGYQAGYRDGLSRPGVKIGTADNPRRTVINVQSALKVIEHAANTNFTHPVDKSRFEKLANICGRLVHTTDGNRLPNEANDLLNKVASGLFRLSESSDRYWRDMGVYRRFLVTMMRGLIQQLDEVVRIMPA